MWTKTEFCVFINFSHSEVTTGPNYCCCIAVMQIQAETQSNIIYELQWTNEHTSLWKIYLSHFILERVDVSVGCERWVETHILRERTYIFFQKPGVPTFAPTWQLVRDASGRLHDPRSTVILCTQSKSDRVILITWSPSGYTRYVPDCPDRAVIFLFTNQNVTVCQSTRGH